MPLMFEASMEIAPRHLEPLPCQGSGARKGPIRVMDLKTQVEFLFSNLKTENEKIELIAALIERLEDPAMRADILGRFRTEQLDPIMVLPPEIGVLIFQFLDRQELSTAARVSRRWKSLAYDKSLLIDKIKKGCFYCTRCKIHLGKDEDIIAQTLRLDHQLAYRVKAMDHIELGKMQKVEIGPGVFNVAPASCSNCQAAIGLKYVEHLSGPNSDLCDTFVLKKKMLYFPAENMKNRTSLACKKCTTPIGLHEDIMDDKYQLGGGQASLVSQLINLSTDTPVDVQYTSGTYRVCNITCASCNHNLGVKYIHAADAKNAFKIDTFLIENSKYEIVFPVFKQKQKNRGVLGNFFRFLRKSV
eukprot:TRINITY_DN7881_c0_g1_i1.p1 TRINITY_DN7881_c0_g1~~TRINITY_DN7881_c0_g1_i1.p1  ORF type:complete len:358 (+),score=67.43 TRINITY_DN7881_c0_g1_i1:60-1133(+)